MQKSANTTVLILKVRKALNTVNLREQVADWVFSRWHTGFMMKSAGEQDEFGNEWQPLAVSTIAKKELRRTGGFRAVDRNALWKQRNRQLIGQLTRAGMSLKDARAKANALQWQDVDIPINIDTTRLERSLRPEGSRDQVREISDNLIELGTEVPHAKYVERARRILPTSSEAATWLKELLGNVRDQVIREVA